MWWNWTRVCDTPHDAKRWSTAGRIGARTRGHHGVSRHLRRKFSVLNPPIDSGARRQHHVVNSGRLEGPKVIRADLEGDELLELPVPVHQHVSGTQARKRCFPLSCVMAA